MSEQSTPADGTGTPEVTTPAEQATPATPAAQPPAPPAQPPAAAAPPAEKPRIKASDLPDDALKARLEQESRKATEAVYASLGKTPDEVKSLIAAEQERIDAQKSLEQRNAEAAAALQAEQAKASGYLQTIKQRADVELGLLNEAQRSAVTAIAGDDPSAQLKAITAFWPTWQQETASAQPAGQAPAAEPPPVATPAPAPPANTAPPPTAPGAGTPAAEIDHKAKFAEMQQANPFAAAHYGLTHQHEVFTPKT
jgi:2-oxoglutarate dehydrogenase E2 component (dihydrolipoamide succinyltransferase)